MNSGATVAKASPLFMEEHLELSLRELLPLMQTRITQGTTYLGIPTLKNPLDFWVYQELICAVQVDVIVEIGNYCGGSLLALAHLCDARGFGRVIGVDICQRDISRAVRAHPRISLVEGDAVACASEVEQSLRPDERVLVIEDSSHEYENTLAVLRRYAAFVSIGSYCRRWNLPPRGQRRSASWTVRGHR
jgi:cephalosporin hydroxylase